MFQIYYVFWNNKWSWAFQLHNVPKFNNEQVKTLEDFGILHQYNEFSMFLFDSFKDMTKWDWPTINEGKIGITRVGSFLITSQDHVLKFVTIQQLMEDKRHIDIDIDASGEDEELHQQHLDSLREVNRRLNDLYASFPEFEKKNTQYLEDIDINSMLDDGSVDINAQQITFETVKKTMFSVLEIKDSFNVLNVQLQQGGTSFTRTDKRILYAGKVYRIYKKQRVAYIKHQKQYRKVKDLPIKYRKCM